MNPCLSGLNGWREFVLKEFVPGISKLILVADPDDLLTEEKLAFGLQERGFDLIEFNDPVEFRFAFESRYRSIWDQGKEANLTVVLRLQASELGSLPYDLLEAGRKLSFSLGTLFPNLSCPVVEKLDRSLLDTLFEAQQKSSPDRMGENATKDFILRSVFGIAAELIGDDVELLRALLRLHYGKSQIPQILAERVIQVLRSHKEFIDWPLEEIVPDGEAFFAFLQERWPLFLSRIGALGRAGEELAKSGFRYSGPDHLPFDHQDVRIYIDNLFLEGKLIPVEVEGIDYDPGSWFRSGIITTGVDDEELRIVRLFDMVEQNLPTAEARHSEWAVFALKWAELSSLVFCRSNDEHQTRLRKIGEALNTNFAGWLTGHYSNLVNLPPTNPAMVHHVPRRLARDIEDSADSRIALIVIDGLSLDQWVTMRSSLQKQDPEFLMREFAVFAWIPTLTPVSRQSIFSGKPPLYFPSSIHSTNSEANLWKQFWEGHDLSRMDVVYQRGLGDGDASALLDAVIQPGKTRVVGLVVDKIDKIMHGMQLGSAGMHNQVKQWCQGGFLAELVRMLLDYRFDVWLTADHGSIQCEGRGRPSEGVIAETRGERVRVYPTPELRSRVASLFPFAHEWDPTGLPADYFPLVACGFDAFVNPGEMIVGHGGISVEEVIVPFVKIEKRTR
ncbi:BREX-3 system phosphatase PglZ [Aminivibrio sp.]|uniref:BREX-3 system phosphatase PglZ n=1 Tax=Aminivibrio sp. TaxID=1872489 RepID=UPI001A55167A|nr:BREX-3 system phosphatase PglZ [Aminivibrio sp.]MBL3538487.1 BREX-3 system phosphatase PglZ [Aminivibrio sp.]